EADGVVELALQCHQRLPQLANVGLAAVRCGVAAHEGLQRIAQRGEGGHRALAPAIAEHELVHAHARRDVGDEDATTRPRLGHEQPALLHEPDRLVDRRRRDAEALAQLLLGPDPLAGAGGAPRDLGLQLARDRLRQRDAGAPHDCQCRIHPRSGPSSRYTRMLAIAPSRRRRTVRLGSVTAPPRRSAYVAWNSRIVVSSRSQTLRISWLTLKKGSCTARSVARAASGPVTTGRPPNCSSMSGANRATTASPLPPSTSAY